MASALHFNCCSMYCLHRSNYVGVQLCRRYVGLAARACLHNKFNRLRHLAQRTRIAVAHCGNPLI